MSNPLNVSFGELPAPEETGGPLPLWRLQSGGRFSENNHTSQDELPTMVKAWGWNEGLFKLDWRVREGFLGVVMRQVRSRGSEGGSLVEREEQVEQAGG